MHESLTPLQIRVATLATELGRMLSDRAVGIVGFAARDIVEHVRLALEALGDHELRAALGGGSVARILFQHGPRLLGRPLDYDLHARRAKHTVTVLRWIADAGDVQAAARRLGPADPVIAAAQAIAPRAEVAA